MSRPKPVALSRALRENQTDAERLLWAKLRELRPSGVRFRRQHAIGTCIVDFVCLDKKLVIEVDGGHHNEAPQLVMDARRTRWLESEGFRVLRFWNNDVLFNIEGVIWKVCELLNESPPHLNLLPRRGEEDHGSSRGNDIL